MGLASDACILSEPFATESQDTREVVYRRSLQAWQAASAYALEPFFLFSAHRFFIKSDNRFLPAGVRWSPFFLL